jgi:hypothetical protein
LHSYVTYGLNIHSAFNLPELRASNGAIPDVVVTRERISWSPPRLDEDGTCFQLGASASYLHWQSVGTFLVSDGRTIAVDPDPRADDDLIRLPLLGIVLAVLLHQRGLLVLHASAVALGGRAVVFLGEKGQGKSTIAAALYGHGHAFLADDLVALDDAQGFVVQPGYAQIKLWPEAAVSSLGDDPATLPVLATGVDHRVRRVVREPPAAPVPAAAIYVLATGNDLRIERLAPGQVLLQLIAHTYVARFGQQLLSGALGARHLQQCTRLSGGLPVYRLERARSLELLPQAVALLEAELAR